MTEKVRLNKSIFIPAIVVIAVGILYRVWALGRIPGINGDETWFAMQAMNLLSGREDVIWEVPTGRWHPPIMLFVSTLFHLFFDPSLLLARLPSLLAGLLTLYFGFKWVSKMFSKEIAWVFLILLATSPVAIAYTRLSFDSSWNPFLTLLCIYLAYRSKWVLLALAWVLALSTHITNGFLLPTLLIPIAFAFWNKQRSPRKEKAVRTAIFVFGILALAKISIDVFTPHGQGRSIGTLLHHFFHMKTWSSMVVMLGEFFNGITVFTYFSNEPSAVTKFSYNAAFWIIALPFLLLGSWRVWVNRVQSEKTHELFFVTGVFGTFALFSCGAGPVMLLPDVSRYGLVLAVPVLLAFSILFYRTIEYLLDRYQADRRYAVLVASNLGAVSLFAFYFSYLEPLLDGEVDSPVNRTAAVEPKRQIYDWIQSDIARKTRDDTEQKNAEVILQDVWITWPVKYLSYRKESRIRARMFEPPQDHWEELKKTVQENRPYVVGYTNSLFQDQEAELFGNPNQWKKKVIKDGAGRDFVTIWAPI